MSATYTDKTGLWKGAFDDQGWNDSNNGNFDLLDALAPVGSLCVRAREIPSSSLYVKVGSGRYRGLDGTISDYPGVASQLLPAFAVTVLYVDAFGALQLASSYPAATAYVPLATVVTSGTAITSIADDRAPAPMVGMPAGGTLYAAADDAAAATAGIAIGCLYRTGSQVKIRVS